MNQNTCGPTQDLTQSPLGVSVPLVGKDALCLDREKNAILSRSKMFLLEDDANPRKTLIALSGQNLLNQIGPFWWGFCCSIILSIALMPLIYGLLPKMVGKGWFILVIYAVVAGVAIWSIWLHLKRSQRLVVDSVSLVVNTCSEQLDALDLLSGDQKKQLEGAARAESNETVQEELDAIVQKNSADLESERALKEVSLNKQRPKKTWHLTR